MTNPFTETTTWSYQNNDWLATQTLANGATATYTFNALGQVTRLLNQLGGNTISDFSSITYDGAGNRKSITASIPGATSLSGVTDFTYDTKDQLTQESSTRNGGFTDNFGYDTAGNPTSFKGVSKNYNSNNQQTGTGFAYDNNGNPTTYNGTTLTFDPENRMTAFGTALTAGYRGDGLRAWNENSSTRTYFLYDGIVPVVELDSSGAVLATNSFGASGLISRREASTTVYYTFDAGGSVAHRSDASGSLLSNNLFSAHGAILSGTLNEPFGYKAQFSYYTDNETGLQLLAHRYYDPSSGRFLTRDPISYAGGLNLYSYTRNNPVNGIDPWGLQDGPVNYLRDPFSYEHWILNGASNSFSDFLSLDAQAGYWYQVGDHCQPGGERAWAATKGVGLAAITALGGPVLKRVGGFAISALGRRMGSAAAEVGAATKQLGTARDNLLHAATNPRLGDAINNLYRPGASLGNGSSMDALRIEGSHLIKVLGRRTQLMRIRSGEVLNSADRQILRGILIDIQDALGKHLGSP
jgi:RHS repeat-associated protein